MKHVPAKAALIQKWPFASRMDELEVQGDLLVLNNIQLSAAQEVNNILGQQKTHEEAIQSVQNRLIGLSNVVSKNTQASIQQLEEQAQATKDLEQAILQLQAENQKIKDKITSLKVGPDERDKLLLDTARQYDAIRGCEASLQLVRSAQVAQQVQSVAQPKQKIDATRAHEVGRLAIAGNVVIGVFNCLSKLCGFY